jgi:hypothetical protein
VASLYTGYPLNSILRRILEEGFPEVKAGCEPGLCMLPMRSADC